MFSVTEPEEFVPAEFDPPRAFTAGGFHLEPLGPEQTVSAPPQLGASSMEHIRRSPGYPDGEWSWEMSLEENRADLERHARDFADRSGFTFTVLDTKG